jgi:hypothetical protein
MAHGKARLASARNAIKHLLLYTCCKAFARGTSAIGFLSAGLASMQLAAYLARTVLVRGAQASSLCS